MPQEEIIAIYADPEYTQKVEDFDVGEVEAGTTAQKEFYIENISGGTLNDLRFRIEGTEPLPTVEVPTIIPINGRDKVTVTVAVPLEIKKSLDYRITVTGKVIYPPD